VAVLNEAVRLAPNEKAEVHLRLASLYIAAGAKDRAANEYRLFLAKRPDFKDRTKLEAYIKENGK
jgi:Tfp pilus assembly protein PilF